MIARDECKSNIGEYARGAKRKVTGACMSLTSHHGPSRNHSIFESFLHVIKNQQGLQSDLMPSILWWMHTWIMCLSPLSRMFLKIRSREIRTYVMSSYSSNVANERERIWRCCLFALKKIGVYTEYSRLILHCWYHCKLNEGQYAIIDKEQRGYYFFSLSSCTYIQNCCFSVKWVVGYAWPFGGSFS